MSVPGVGRTALDHHACSRTKPSCTVGDGQLSDFHVIVNLAVGGTLAGSPGHADYRNGVLTVDYVRVWSL